MSDITNEQINRLFGIDNVHGIVKRHECLTQEVNLSGPLPLLAGLRKIGIPLKQTIFFDCEICLYGKIPVDLRRGLQFQQCNSCQNVFKVRKTGMGGYKLQYAPDVLPTPERGL